MHAKKAREDQKGLWVTSDRLASCGASRTLATKGAIALFHEHNYDKVFEPHAYKGDPSGVVAVTADGYITGENLRDQALVYFRTFYDLSTGRRKFGELRGLLKQRTAVDLMPEARMHRHEAPPSAWGCGYPLHFFTLRPAF